MSKPAQVDVLLNNEKAKREMVELQDKIKEFIRLRDEAIKDKNMPLFDKLNKITKDATAELRKMEKQTYDVEKVLANISGSSINSLEKALTAANREMKKMERDGVSGYEEQRKKVKQLREEIDKVNDSNRVGESWWSRMSSGFNKYVGMVATGVATIGGAIFSGEKLTEIYNKFQEKLGSVSSLTGIVGDQLNKLGDDSRKMSHSTVEGVRITESATDILEAFKLMGSAKPELLQDSEALKQVTQDAMILNAAAKDELKPTVESLALTMNQFGAGADQSRKYINVLAAGALAGSAEIGDISDSITKFGAASAAANITVEQSVALIETLAEKGLKGELAGTQLKGVLLKLQAGADDTNPAIVGLNTALENLKNKNLSAAEMTKKFGLENYIAAQIVTSHVDRVNYFTKAVTGTNTAIEQAIINTDNNNAKQAQATNRMNNAAITVGQKLAPAYLSGKNAVASMVEGIANLISSFHIWGPLLLSAVVGIGTYTVVTNLAAIKEGIWTAAKWVGATAQRALNAAMAANPIGLIVAGLAAAATALFFFVSRTSEATKMMREHKKALEDNAQALDHEKIKTDQLVKSAADEKQSKIDRLKALNQLKTAAGGYLDSLTLENIATDKGSTLLKNYNKELEKKIWLEGNQKELSANIEEQRKLERERFGIDGTGGTFKAATDAKKAAEKGTYTRGTGGMYSSGLTDKETKEIAAKNAADADAEVSQKITALRKQEQLLNNEKKNLFEKYGNGSSALDNASSTTPPAGGDKDSAADIARAHRLMKLEQERKEEKITKEKYDEEIIKSDIQYYKDKMELSKASEKEKADATKQFVEETEKLRKLYYDRDLKKAEDSSNDQKNVLIKQHNEEKINDATFKALTLQTDLDFLNKKMELQKAAGISTIDTQKEYDRKILDAAAESNALLLKAKEELNKAGYDNIKDAIEKQIALENETWEKELIDLKNRLIIKESLSEKEIELNDTINKLIEEKTKAHNDKISDLNTARSIEQLDYNELAAKTDEERWTAQAAKAKAAYNSDLKLAGDNQLKKLQAEKKYAKASLDIENEKIEKLKSIRMRDVANAEMAVNILATVVGKNTILGKALFVAQQGFAIARIWIENAAADAQIYAKNLVMFATSGPMAPGLAAAWSAPAWTANKTSALLNTGLIAAQTIAGLMGKKSGGFTDEDSSDDKIVDYVHSNEFVANAGAVRNPTIKPILDIIDYAQRSGTIRTINLPAVIAASSGLSSSGKKEGGFTSPSVMSIPSFDFPSFGNDPELKSMVAENARINAALLKRLEQPITADVSLLGPNGFIEKQAKLSRIQKNANF